jgi:hypothetical protein
MDKEIILNHLNKGAEIPAYVACGIAAGLTAELQSFGARVKIFSCDTIHPVLKLNERALYNLSRVFSMKNKMRHRTG